MMASPSIDTRNEAYRSLGDVTDKQRAVLDALRVGPMSDRALAKRLGWPINRVVPRRHELVEAGLVRAAYRDTDGETGRPCVVWEVVRS